MRVIDRFQRLRNHSVIRSYDQHDNVRGLRARARMRVKAS